MPPTIGHSNIWRCAGVVNLLAAITLSVGCATEKRPASAQEEPVPVTMSLAPHPVPVVRYGRYTLVDLKPQTAQEDLLQQVVDISIPGTMSATVGDGMRYLLLRSGYRLCDAPGDASTLYALPLPAAHLHLGPAFVRDALQTLAGSAWHLQVDDVVRQVCFTRASNAADTLPTQPAPATPTSAKAETGTTTRALPERRP